MVKKLVFKLLYLLLTLSLLAGFAAYYASNAIYQQPSLNSESVSFIIKPGQSIKTISTALQQQGIVSQHPLLIQAYARLTKRATAIKAGEYQIQAATTVDKLITQFVEGKVVQHAFTIIEGYTTQQMLAELAKNNQLEHTLKLEDASQLAQTLGFDHVHPEGIFLPETYHFPTGMADIEFLQRAHQQMQTTLDELWQQRAKDLPYKTPYEALIMASIIEKESGVADERPEIAGVFVRRLKKGMRLQTDPTVIYGLGDQFNGNLRRKHLRTDTPYNTYTRFGLPPSPICLPSREAIEAALHPAAGKSLYFVATGKEGRHVFSDNLKDHNKAVRKYQLKK